MHIIMDYVKHLWTSTSGLYGVNVSNGPYDMMEKRRGQPDISHSDIHAHVQNNNLKLDCVEGHTNMQITLSNNDVYFYKKKNKEPSYTMSGCTTIAT